MAEQAFVAGHLFFEVGAPADRAYILNEGQVELLSGVDIAFTRIRLVQPGEGFGETALIEERPRSFTARALTDGTVAVLTREEFERDLTLTPLNTQKQIRALFERLRSPSPRPTAETQTAVTANDVQATTSVKPIPSAAPELPTGGKVTGWIVVIHPLTRKASETLPDEGLQVSRFPLRIGRVTEAHEREALDLNDLWLLDSKPYNVSRNHCEIQVDRDGPMVCDRGSHLGCIVNDEPIGGRMVTDYARLELGENVVILGGRMSQYQFRVTVRHV